MKFHESINSVSGCYIKKTLIFAPLALIGFALWLVFIIGFSREVFGYIENFLTALYMIFLFSIGALLTYTLWFISKSDQLFKLLNFNRPIANILNIIGLFIIPGLSFLITPLIVWWKTYNLSKG